MAKVQEDLIMEANGDRLVTDGSAHDKTDKGKKKVNMKRLLMTAAGGFVTFFLGMQISQKGPAFLDLQLISGTDLEGASTYVSGNMFGYMVGSLLAGFIYNRINNKFIAICIPLTLGSILTALTPLCTSYVTMLLIHIVTSTQSAIPETIITAEELRRWHGKSDAAVQFLSFCYSFGGVLGPLYTEPFLLPVWNDTDDRSLKEEILLKNSTEASYVTSLPSAFINNFTSPASVEGNQTSPLSHPNPNPEDSKLFYAFLITGIVGVISAIPYYYVSIQNCVQGVHETKQKEEQAKGPRRLTLKPYIILTVVGSFFFFIYSMTEDSFNMFLPMFVVSHLSWTKEDGALISSLYWGIGTVSKLLIIFLARRCDMGIIMLISCIVMVVSLVAFVVASSFHIHVLVWISSAGFGMGQASIFGGCFAWVDKNILKLDGVATSVAMIFAASGAMVGPLILGVAISEFGHMMYAYIQLIESIINLLYFVFMFFILKPFVTRKYGPPRPEIVIDYEENVEFDEEIKCDHDVNNSDDDTNEGQNIKCFIKFNGTEDKDVHV